MVRCKSFPVTSAVNPVDGLEWSKVIAKDGPSRESHNPWGAMMEWRVSVSCSSGKYRSKCRDAARPLHKADSGQETCPFCQVDQVDHPQLRARHDSWNFFSDFACV